MQFDATERWHARWPGAVVACMRVAGVSNPERAPELDACLDRIELALRDRYAGLDRAALRAREPFAAYERYYRQFGQTYHVWRQVESVAAKGKPIPRRAALVEAAFAEELRSGLLTAMHDGDRIGPEIVTDIAAGGKVMVTPNGGEVRLDDGDMLMRDATGLLSSVVRGPAAYGLVTPETTNVVVCVYAPEGIGEVAVREHLEAIAANMQLVAPGARVDFLEIVAA